MNERIQELIYNFNNEVGVMWANEDKLKFAELIVQECVGRIQLHNRMDEVTEQWVYDNLVSDVKEHFGVK